MEKNESVERKNQNPNPGTTCSSFIALVLHTHLVSHQNNHDPPHLQRFAFCCLCLSLPATPFSRKTIAQKIEPATTTTWRRLTTRPTPPQPPRWSLFSRRKHCCTMSLPRDPRRLRPPPPPPPKMPLCPHDPRLPKDTSPTPTTVVPAAVPAAVPAKESRLPPKLHLR